MENQTETLAGTPFAVSNGNQFEVHDYEYDNDGRRWEITVSGPFDDVRLALKAVNNE